MVDTTLGLMLPVVSVAEMKSLDAEALRSVGEDVLVEKAGTAVAQAALAMLHGGYGRRVLVVAGKGNNGADGRVAARLLARRGALVEVIDPAGGKLVRADRRSGGVPGEGERGAALLWPVADLVIDAAFGTGFKGTYDPPGVPPGVPVLAVDIPSGVQGDSGEAAGSPLAAERTVSMAALKPGLLQWDGRRLSGTVEVVDIGIDARGVATTWLVEDSDVVVSLRAKAVDAHKWETAVAIVGGSPGMAGAALLAARGASRAGAGMVRLLVPEGAIEALPPGEAVVRGLPAEGLHSSVEKESRRCKVLVAGPGLGRSSAAVDGVRGIVASMRMPLVIDADGLYALGDGDEAARVLRSRPSDFPPVVLTPHDGEATRLAGRAPGKDRLAAAADLASRLGAIVLLKGATTVVASPPAGVESGEGPGSAPALRYVVTSGSPRLATAGSGDVLSGVIGAFIARDVPPALAAALAAHVHGRAASLGRAEGMISFDLPDLVSAWLSAAGCGALEGAGIAC